LNSPDVIDTFLAGARVVATAIAEQGVAAAWEHPSVLAERSVGGLAGHLARGGIWLVGELLEGPTPEDHVDVESASENFAGFARSAT
jgi:hypothetical protein